MWVSINDVMRWSPKEGWRTVIRVEDHCRSEIKWQCNDGGCSDEVVWRMGKKRTWDVENESLKVGEGHRKWRFDACMELSPWGCHLNEIFTRVDIIFTYPPRDGLIHQYCPPSSVLRSVIRINTFFKGQLRWPTSFAFWRPSLISPWTFLSLASDSHSYSSISSNSPLFVFFSPTHPGLSILCLQNSTQTYVILFPLSQLTCLPSQLSQHFCLSLNYFIFTSFSSYRSMFTASTSPSSHSRHQQY